MALLESCLVEVPVVMGFVRPVILMPVGILAGLSTSQVESILIHELAHIRRWDYLVNLMQIRGGGAAVLSPGGVVGLRADPDGAGELLRRRGGADEGRRARICGDAGDDWKATAGRRERRHWQRREGIS